ncbi:tetratricopeptide repeat protein [Oceanithermus desulfurans]|uniref:Cystathionine beta-synthase n=2 Tax=Oceanithermus desulfurans TaxID=227924 RepID=A0A511RIG6_9DEIN|nr:tetratricopeptide repeat protein [Oceanithermus desulfurans]MBB6030680.1 cytochrome c-type biogenesis protein CcmH/NrfG [Oceanithermus desulfurans]GEM89441.1 cystathionine beta-synthase [Oceanithermus desulfurans NBRC 100063]
MILFWTVVALLVLLAAVYATLPLAREPEPFPADPLPEELRAEIEALKQEARELEGSERKRTLGRIVQLERRLAELEGRPAAPRTRRVSWVALMATTAFLVFVGGVLLRYTLPRAPGETITTSNLISGERAVDRAKLAELNRLKAQAERNDDAESWLAYGNAAWEVADYNAAAEAYKRVLDLDSKNLTAWKRMGILFFMSGFPEDAAQVLQVVVGVDPNDPEALLFLGNAYSMLGRFDEAVGVWERYLAVGGPDAERVKALIAQARAQQEAKAAVDRGQAPDGNVVYEAKCAACHGQNAEGGIGPRLVGNPVLRVDGAVAEIVKKGTGSMPAIPMSEAELQALLDYLKGL